MFNLDPKCSKRSIVLTCLVPSSLKGCNITSKQSKRDKIIDDFRMTTLNTLISTNVLARGIDVPEVDLVINYDVPQHSEDYVHRIGRTGRARTEGEAFTLCKPEELSMVDSIEKLLGNPLPRKFVDDFGYREERSSLAPTAPQVSKKRNRGFGKQVSFGGRRKR